MNPWERWLLIGALGVGLLVVGGPFVYFRFIQGKAPVPLSLWTSSPSASPTTGATNDSVEGNWSVADGSQVGYRVKEILFGQSGEAVGRTEEVTGSITIEGSTVTKARFSVDMATVTSDENRRDNKSPAGSWTRRRILGRPSS